MINDSRPKWLRGALGVFAAWWSFWICLVALLALTIGTADAILPGDGVKPLSGAILAIISLADATLVAIVVSVKFSKLVEPAFLGYKV